MDRFPNFGPDADIIHIAGMWFGNDNAGQPEDDGIPFLACVAQPPSPLMCPHGTLRSEDNLLDNVAGQNFALLNSVMQPTFRLQVSLLIIAHDSAAGHEFPTFVCWLHTCASVSLCSMGMFETVLSGVR